ncbi:MAG TPA: DUF3185 domain-containing protein [Methylomirabilota bacterium]|nr:DUF3185 domain-containing protein [Methylomirabilota bacterium]
MKASTLIGIALVVMGTLALIYKGITYKDSEAVLDVGPLKATAERSKTIPISPIVGVAAIAGGVLLIWGGGKKAKH